MDAITRNPAGCEQESEFDFALALLPDEVERLQQANCESDLMTDVGAWAAIAVAHRTHPAAVH